jgi:ferredoxin
MTSPNPILSTLENFPLVYSAMVKPSTTDQGDLRYPVGHRRRAQAGQAPVPHLRQGFFEVSRSGNHIQSTASKSRRKPARRSWRPPMPRASTSRGSATTRGCATRAAAASARSRRTGAAWRPARNRQAAGLTVENETPHVTKLRRDLVEMLFHEGNHLCPICEASGNCELQAMAYRLDMTSPRKFPYLEPCRAVDASHPDIALDTNRCISCGRCIRASQDVDGKGVFGYVGRGIHRRVAVNGPKTSLIPTRASTMSRFRPRSARWAASSANASASRCRSANGNSTRA